MRILNPALALVGAAVALAPAWVWAQAPSDEKYGYGPPMMWWGGGWPGMILGPLFMILVLAAVIAVVLLFARSIGGPWHGAPPYQGPPSRTPLDILKERFARGEIDKQEFDERRRVLGE
jgi:putative membrane protein